MEKERDIYIKDMLFYILKKWRFILIWMIIFAVAANGFSALKSYKSVAESHQEQKSKKDELENIKAELSKDDAKEVEETYKIYLKYKSSMDSILEYYNNSIKMNMDSNNVPTISMQYQINKNEKINDVIMAFSDVITSKEVCEKIKEDTNLDCDLQYISELIEVKRANPEKEYTDGEQILIQDDISDIMCIRVIAPTQEMCETIANVVEKEIQSGLQTVQDKLGNFNLIQINKNYSEKVDDDLFTKQQEYASKLNSIQISINNLNSPLESNQENYYKALINQNNDEQNSDEQETQVVETAQIRYFNIKYIIAGLMLGLICAVVWYLLRYIFNQCLLEAWEMEDYYGVRVLELFDDPFVNNKNRFFEKIIHHVFKTRHSINEERKIQMVCAYIQIAIEKYNMTHVHLTSAWDTEAIKLIKDKIVQNMDCDSIKITMGDSVISDSNSLKEMVNSDGVVLIEQVRKSDFKDIGKEINVCKDYKKTIIGAVVIA